MRTVRRAAVVALSAAAFSALAVTFATAAGPPEIDRANATIAVQPTAPFTATRCPGEDATTYITYRGGWAGAENEVTPGFTDYPLSGSVRFPAVTWTVNLKTRRGVLTAAARLTSAAGAPVYSGRLTLVTQGLPTAGALVPGRGWIAASTQTAGKADGGSLLANVEFGINGGFNAQGQFGDAAGSKGIPDFSVTTANLTC